MFSEATADITDDADSSDGETLEDEDMVFAYLDFLYGPDGTQESTDAAYDRFRAFLDQGHPL